MLADDLIQFQSAINLTLMEINLHKFQLFTRNANFITVILCNLHNYMTKIYSGNSHYTGFMDKTTTAYFPPFFLLNSFTVLFFVLRKSHLI